MKIVHVFIFLTINTIPISCMHIRKCKPYKITDQIEPQATPGNTTIPLNVKAMEELYNCAYLYITAHDTKKLHSENNDDFVRLVRKMHNTYSTGIHEDMMGNFTYNKYINSSSLFPVPAYVTLLFGCLKRYRLAGELFPFDIHNTSTYPAYNTLASTMKTLPHLHSEKVKLLADCLYISEKTVFKDCSQGCYLNLENELYSKAYDLLLSTSCNDAQHHRYNEIYDLIQIIENAKKSNVLCCESDLIPIIDKLDDPIMTQFCSSFYSDKTKNSIKKFYLSLEKYNKDRNNKITPTGKQYSCYQLKNNINFALPDSFSTTLFDEKLYAFTEFTALINDILQLKQG